MQSRARVDRRWPIGAGLLGLALGLGTVGATATPESPPAEDMRLEDYPVNENGLSYGSALFAASPNDEPDLILVVGDSGIEGYSLADDLHGPTPGSPSEALRLQEDFERQGGVRSIPVYDASGENQIDIFTITSTEDATRDAQ